MTWIGIQAIQVCSLLSTMMAISTSSTSLETLKCLLLMKRWTKTLKTDAFGTTMVLQLFQVTVQVALVFTVSPRSTARWRAPNTKTFNGTLSKSPKMIDCQNTTHTYIHEVFYFYWLYFNYPNYGQQQHCHNIERILKELETEWHSRWSHCMGE